jgi:hypothetical protein
MSRSFLPAAFALAMVLIAGSTRAAEPFEMNVKAFTPAGAPIGEQTATCSAAEPCRFSWPTETEGQFKAVTIVIKEAKPGLLQAIAMHGLESRSVRFSNAAGATAILAAVKSAPTRPDVVLLKFTLTRR